MTYGELKIEAEKFYPAILLDRIMPRKSRKFFRNLFGIISDVCFTISIIIILADRVDSFGNLLDKAGFQSVIFYADKIYGIFFLAMALWIVLFAFECYYNIFYFKAVKPRAIEKDYGFESPISLEAASIVLESKRDDLTKSFLESEIGRLSLSRLGISRDSVKAFLHDRKSVPNISEFSLESAPSISAADLAREIFRLDGDFSTFILQKGLSEDDFAGSVLWMQRIEMRIKKNERWWGSDALGKIPGIGEDWSYGQAYLLKKYGTEAFMMPEYWTADAYGSYNKKELGELESSLSKMSGANALVVGPVGSGKMDMIFRFARKIMEGDTGPALARKKVIVLDSQSLVGSFSDKANFEDKLSKILNECAGAGNVILAIADFSAFVSESRALGSDIFAVLEPYLASPKIQIVAVCDTESFHSLIEPNQKIMSRFEKVQVGESKSDAILRMLEDIALPVEISEGVRFTYPALRAVAESAERYFEDFGSREKAKNLLLELVPKAKNSKTSVISKSYVLELVEEKTGIPVSGVKEDEKKKLLNLEKILHERIIGQDEAVKTISNAMRRARAGIENPNRPIGSFLFLGPTGVGKTETAKALSDVFFGEKASMMRLDMSEYNSPEALEKLIGSFEAGKFGVLSSMLRDQAYGVLLLDEFEKASREAHDLFLQILDEGFFSDMAGRKINARNLIIIATSNAGSDMIWEMVKGGKDLALGKDEIVDGIIKKGIFKPELLNRFDGVIVFHPLKDEELAKVARLMLSKLESRLKEKGFGLDINDTLLNYLVKVGSDPKFGARPINRAIQEKVEQVIADKMLKGEIHPGSKISLGEGDLK